jgi:HSP20 family protein
MAIAPYRASTDLFRPLFEEFFGGPTEGSRLGNLMRAPAADVVETENEIRVVAEMPGIRPEEVNVDIENNLLTIYGEKHEERETGGENSTWHLSERRYGSFSRSFVLPRDVNQESIQASFENGILTVTIPKSERARRRRIDVKPNGLQQGEAGHQQEATPQQGQTATR